MSQQSVDPVSKLPNTSRISDSRSLEKDKGTIPRKSTSRSAELQSTIIDTLKAQLNTPITDDERKAILIAFDDRERMRKMADEGCAARIASILMLPTSQVSRVLRSRNFAAAVKK